MSRRNWIVPALFAAALSPAAAQDTAQAHATVMPSRAVGRTHDCSGYYPDTARRLNQSGDVMVSYDVGADGAISNVVVIQPSGTAALDRAAIVCVSQHWRSTPATRGGIPVASPHHQAIIAFQLLSPTPQGWQPVAVAPAQVPVAQPRAAQAPTVNPNALSPFAAFLGGLALAALLAMALRLIFSRRVCPACGHVNRSLLLGPHYCSACGTRFSPRD